MVYIDLLKGDCLQVLKDISSNSIDCFICDLPYGCLAARGTEKSTQRRFIDGKDTGTTLEVKQHSSCAWDVKIDLPSLWTEIKRLCKNDNTPVLMFCTTKFGNELINSNPKWFRYDLVWDKEWGTSFLTANKMPLRAHEMIYVFAKSGAYFNRVDVKGDYKGWKAQATDKQTQRGVLIGGEGTWKANENNGTRCVKSVITMKKRQHTKSTHPTEKPIELYKFLIERYCVPGGTVLDPTAGSFNSCFAAYELNRNAIGIEKDDAFYKIACEKADTLDATH